MNNNFIIRKIDYILLEVTIEGQYKAATNNITHQITWPSHQIKNESKSWYFIAKTTFIITWLRYKYLQQA